MTELQRATIALNQAIDAYWNDYVRGLGLTGMGEHHMIRITAAQRLCREALKAENVTCDLMSARAMRSAEKSGDTP